MPLKNLTIRKLNSGGLITTYSCTSSCAHCLYRSSPSWPKEYLNIETADMIFGCLKRLGCCAIHIGGGEPLYSPGLILPVLDCAKVNGISIEYIETNSSWFKDPRSSAEIIRMLKEHGVNSLLISISPFHNEFIPFYKVKGVIDICKTEGVSLLLWKQDFYNEIDSFEDKKTHSLEEYRQAYGDDYIETIPDRYRVSYGGRAIETFGKLRRGQTVPSLVRQTTQGCAELASVDHFHFDYLGNYIPGLCSGLSIQIADLGSALDTAKYPIITRLFSKGIGGLLSYAMEEFGFEASKPVYFSKCELCNEIRKFLVTEARICSPELQPTQYYYL
jgi:organic radical activating enzyme